MKKSKVSTEYFNETEFLNAYTKWRRKRGIPEDKWGERVLHKRSNKPVAEQTSEDDSGGAD